MVGYGVGVGSRFGAQRSSASGSSTVLRRESDGSVTVLSLANPYRPILTRQSDGSVTVEAA